jgi:hypothetical protein
MSMREFGVFVRDGSLRRGSVINQVHNQFQAHTMRASIRQAAFPGFVPVRSMSPSRPFLNPPSRLSDPGMEGARCARGFMIGCGLEATAAILLYGVWELWHFFR